VQSIAAGLARLLSDEPRRSELARAGPRRAAEFSWERFAERTLQVLQSVSRRS
jgi:glycosyltransferase involved in cell wall biosynthesis